MARGWKGWESRCGKNVKYVTGVKWGEDGSTELLLAPKAFNGMVAQLWWPEMWLGRVGSNPINLKRVGADVKPRGACPALSARTCTECLWRLLSYGIKVGCPFTCYKYYFSGESGGSLHGDQQGEKAAGKAGDLNKGTLLFPFINN